MPPANALSDWNTKLTRFPPHVGFTESRANRSPWQSRPRRSTPSISSACPKTACARSGATSADIATASRRSAFPTMASTWRPCHEIRPCRFGAWTVSADGMPVPLPGERPSPLKTMESVSRRFNQAGQPHDATCDRATPLPGFVIGTRAIRSTKRWNHRRSFENSLLSPSGVRFS